MSADRAEAAEADGNNKRPTSLILLLAGLCLSAYLILALAGDLRANRALLLGGHVWLLAGMFGAWWVLRRHPADFRVVLLAAVAFRVVAALGEPALSDDVFRYVWDGRVQLAGIQPYRHAPDDPALEQLRDGEVWPRVNHRELRTVYPPLAQGLFGACARLGLGPVGFKLVLGGIDSGAVLALAVLLAVLGLPRDRVVLYAWNPLAVLESAGSGHVDSLGVLLVLLVAAWVGRRPLTAAALLGAAIHTKLLPLLLVPGYVRRLPLPAVAVLGLVAVGLLLPYAITGPPIGSGLLDYAERWEYNASLFAGVRAILEGLDTGETLKPWIGAWKDRLGEGIVPWEAVYRNAWPEPLARILVGLALVAWVLRLTFRRGLDASRETFLILAGALLLAPTVHPWYVLWVLPFAAVYLSRPWLVFAALVPLAYLGGEGDPGWGLRLVWYLPLYALLVFDYLRDKRTSGTLRAPVG